MSTKMLRFSSICSTVIIMTMILADGISRAQNVIQIEAGTNKIYTAMTQAASGDTIELISSGGLYQEDSTLISSFPITIKAAKGLTDKPVWEYAGDGKMLIIEADTRLFGIKMSGLYSDDVIDENDSTRYAMRTDSEVNYIICHEMEFDQFEYVLRGDSGSYTAEIRFNNCLFTNIEYYVFRFRDYSSPPGQFGLLHIENCTAAAIGQYFLRADLFPSADTIAEIRVNHCTFYKIGLEQSFHAVFRIDDTADISIKNCLFNQTGIVISTSQASVRYCNIMDTGGFNIWSEPVLEYNFNEDPEFADPENFDFSVSTTFAHKAIGDDGLTVGDPRWAPESLNSLDDLSQQALSSFHLFPNYPNPFNPTTLINYQLPVHTEVELSIYNMLGQKVATLVSERQSAGDYQIEWDASDFASGVYYYQLHTSIGFVQSKKMILLR